MGASMDLREIVRRLGAVRVSGYQISALEEAQRAGLLRRNLEGMEGVDFTPQVRQGNILGAFAKTMAARLGLGLGILPRKQEIDSKE